jgi:hypothetical protein
VKVVSTNAAVQIYRGFTEVSRARPTAALARIALASAPAPDGALPAARSSEDVRIAIRLLERAIEGARSPDPSPAPPAPLLVVGPDARWFRVRDGEPVRLLKARAARLMLSRLVRSRIEAPGRALSLDALFEAGWPGERIPRRAAANRVHVTLTKLRKLGLAGLLQSRDDGFLLDPAGVVLEALGEPG